MKPLPQHDLDAAIALAEDDLRALHGGRLFLVGCTGFFGVWMLETLLRARQRLALDFELTLLSRDPERFAGAHPWITQAPGLHLWRGDVRDFAFPEGAFTHVVHGATTSAHETFSGEPPLRKFDTVALGTRRVLELCDARSVPDVLYLGSGAVYGRAAGQAELILETDRSAPDPLEPSSSLGEAKRAAELFCAIAGAAGRSRIRIARCFSFVGPLLPLDIHYALGNFIRDGLEGSAIRVTGTGTPVRSYLYMSDLTAWLLAILVRGTPVRAYNVGSEDGRSLLEVATLVGRLTSKPVTRPSTPTAAPSTSAGDRYVPSTERARTELGLVQTVSLEQAVEKTLAFVRS
jgi:nucleoside-diphosphate-sugar epimerase